ncbi:MAG: ferritin [Lentimicrobiaceae bacterium]|jgi:ferritin
MIKEAVENAIINQIKNEEHSSRLYLSMASWCQVNGYPGAAAFLFKQTEEERMHQLKFIHYLNDRNGYSKLLALDNPTAEYKSLLDLFEKVMIHEEFITASINDLYEIALNNKDYTTGNFLQWYINEQIEEEITIHNILDKMKLAGNESGGLFLIDKELAALAAAKIIAALPA